MATQRQTAGKGTNKTAQNRTGLEAKKKDLDQMVAAAKEFPPSSKGDGVANIGKVRGQYARETAGLGHVPPAVKKLRGAKATVKANGFAVVLMDKIGARIGFERTGARLWHAVVDKLDAMGTYDGGPTREELIHIQREEEEHFHMLTKVMDELGGDPTAITPSADIEAVTSKGVLSVVSDPRTTLLQALESITVAELADHEQWVGLIDLAMTAGHDRLITRFEKALDNERDHVRKVRAWVAAGNGR